MVSSKGCWEGWFYGMIALDETEAGKQASKQAHKKKQSPRSSSPSSTHLLLPLRRGEGKAAQGVHSHHLPLSPPCPRDGNELDVQVGLALVGRRDADAALRGEELRFGGGGGGDCVLEFWTGGWLNTSIALFLLWLTHLPLPNQHEGLGGRRLLPGGRGGRNGGVAAERVDEGLRHAPPAAAAVCGGVRDAGHEEAEAQGAEAEGGGDGVGVRVAGGGGGGKGRLRGDSLGEELGLFFFYYYLFCFYG